VAPDPSQLFDPLAVLKAAWPIFKPFAIVILAISTIRIALVLIKWTRLMRAGMPEIDRMTGRDFEEKIALLLESKGYRVHLTPYAGDWGADLVVSRDGRRSVVQLKRWNRSINPKAVQEVVASKAKYGCEHAMIISNREFTRAAGELARVNQVELWGRQRLARELIQRQSAPPAVTSAPVPPAAIPSASDQGTPWRRPLPVLHDVPDAAARWSAGRESTESSGDARGSRRVATLCQWLGRASLELTGLSGCFPQRVPGTTENPARAATVASLRLIQTNVRSLG